MPRLVDIKLIRRTALGDLQETMKRFEKCNTAGYGLGLLRWIATMSVIDLHSTWERFSEFRLIAALSHNPSNFLKENVIQGIDKIPLGLSRLLIRGSRRYFGFRSVGDLKGIASKFLDKSVNPFHKITATQENYLDTLATIRNCVAHQSDSATDSY